MRVLIVDSDGRRRGRVMEGLGAASDLCVQMVADTLGMLQHVSEFAPDVIIVASEAPARDAIEDLRRVGETQPRPIVMFVDRSEPELAEEALKAGVAAYVVDGLDPARVRGILELAAMQFRVIDSLRRELSTARAELDSRKTIERAKAHIIARDGLTEPEAYRLMRKTAMDRGVTIAAVAAAILSADEAVPPQDLRKKS